MTEFTDANPDGPGLLVIGAHPDDCEFGTGGFSASWVARGGRGRFVALTNGDAGHQTLGGGTLARIRQAEAKAAAARIGVSSIVLDTHDGALLPTMENRLRVIEIIREFRPDLILVHRPNDYHPDHRYTSQIVQDAVYMVTVPNVAAHTERIATDPVVAYVTDRFTRPYPFSPDVVIDIADFVDIKVAALAQHASQVFEWLPWQDGILDEVPQDSDGRQAWLRDRYEPRLLAEANRFRGKLIDQYGPERAAGIRYAEAFEICEYGASLGDSERERLFFAPTLVAKADAPLVGPDRRAGYVEVTA